MSSTNKSSKHYFQGGYDYDFVDENERLRFECPICLLCQRDPHQTSCGHRFCYSCILTWLNEGKTCPKDNCSLGEGDIYPDPMANREILQLFVRCPNTESGCKAVIRLSDAENHISQCNKADVTQRSPRIFRNESVTCESCGEVVDEEANSQSKDHKQLICPNIQIACPFTSAGCTERVPRKDLSFHIQGQMQKHLQLLCEKLLKLQQIQTASVIEPPEGEDAAQLERSSSVSYSSARRDPGGTLERNGLRLSGSNIQSSQKLFQELFQRVVRLEQQNCQLEIINEQLSTKIKGLELNKSDATFDNLGRFCNGNFVWKIAKFSEFHQKMRQNHSFVLYSHGFYTAPFGYKVCLRCNITIVDGEEHLCLYVHLMHGDNDDCLKWPFKGKITLAVLNLQSNRIHKEDFFEEIIVNSDHTKALQRPRTDRNEYGYGFNEFLRVNGLFSGGFVSEDDVLVIRATVQSFD